MKKFVRGLLLVAAVIVGVGVYRGWFSVNKDQIERDESAAKAEIESIERQIKDKASDLKGSTKNQN